MRDQRPRPGLRAPLALLALAALAVTASACDRPRAMGQMNNLVVATAGPLFAELERDIEEALEPRTYTVRDERIFDVANVDPAGQDWGQLRLVRQVMVIGSESDPWVADAIDRHRGAHPPPPSVFQVRNVWAQNQLVTVVLLPEGAPAATARSLLPRAGQMLLEQYTQYARERMFATPPNQQLADSLRANAGFSLLFPRVYYYAEVRPGLFVFRNDHPDPSRLIRSVQVDSRPAAEVEMTAEAARAWRAEITPEYTQPTQVTDAEIVQTRTLQVVGREALEIQGVWSNPPGEWPAAGPYITRLVRCGERIYLVDAWLYAPGTAKFEYMVQLGTILDSFECA
jgi:hypothetical protein